MLRNNYIRLSIFLIAVFTAIGIIYQRMDMFEMMGYKSSSDQTSVEEQLKTATASEKKLDEAGNTDYFSIFRLITNMVPGKKDN